MLVVRGSYPVRLPWAWVAGALLDQLPTYHRPTATPVGNPQQKPSGACSRHSSHQSRAVHPCRQSYITVACMATCSVQCVAIS